MYIRSDNKGFTVIEVLIFIVVSGFLLVSALLIFNGRQAQVQYEQGVRDVDFKIQDTINNVSTGHFPETGSRCLNVNGIDALRLAPGTEAQGTSDECVFAGMAVERGPGIENYQITTILAAKPENIGAPMSLDDPEAKLTPLADRRETYMTSWGLRITGMVDAGGNNVSTVLFLSELGAASASSDQILGSGVQSINLYTADSLEHDQRIDLNSDSGPVYICLENHNGSKRAVITLGADGRELTTSVNQDVLPGDTPCF